MFIYAIIYKYRTVTLEQGYINMSHVYRERPEIPIPEEGHINHFDGRVYLMEESTRKRTVIGVATSENTMHPNDMYRKLFPEAWDTAFSRYNDPKGYEVCVGMYGLCLGASYKNGLYQVLQEAYGPKYTNIIMDYSMYSILERRDVTQLFPERMRKEAIFSDELPSDALLSNIFTYKLTEEMHMQFREMWISRCVERGYKKVWLCIDGSNNDCQMEASSYAEPGDNKSNSEKTVVGYIYAIAAETGEPVCYFVNPGGKVDAQAFQKIIHFLSGYGLDVEGAILDRGFCTVEVVRTLRSLEIDFVIMVPSDANGYRSVLEQCGDTVFFNPEYLIDRKDVYGISKEAKIWRKYPDTGIINLFFSATRSCFRGGEFNLEVSEAKDNAEKACTEGKKPVIPEKFKPFLAPVPGPDGRYQIICNYGAWRTSLRDKGFFSMLSSRDFGPKKTSELYGLRIASETQYRILKSQEGFDTTRVHTDAAMMSKYAICFASSILRHTIMAACQQNGLDTNDMIQKMDRITLLLLDNQKYRFVRDMSLKARKLFAEFSINMDSFDEIARDYNLRKAQPINSQVHTLPDTGKKNDRRRGRQPGSKNKKTLAREAAIAEAKAKGEYVAPEERKRGRPFGAKDSKPRKQRSDVGIKRDKKAKSQSETSP